MIQRHEPVPTDVSSVPTGGSGDAAGAVSGLQRGGPPVETTDPLVPLPARAGVPRPRLGPSVVEVAAAAAARDLIVELGRALHGAGSPSDRTESLLEEAATRCGLAGVFFVTPTSITASFAEGTRVVRGEPADVDLGRLTALEGVVAALGPDPASIEAGREHLAATLAAPPRYGRLTTRLSFVGASTAAAVLIGASAVGALFAGLGALAVGLGLEYAATRPRLARSFLVLASAAVSVAATLLASIVGTDGGVTTLAALIMLLPGLSFTLAMRELAARHLVSGSARLMGAAVDFVAIGFGMALGERIATSLLGTLAEGWNPLDGAGPLRSLDPAWDIAALLVAPLTFVVLFRAPPRAIAPIIGICLAAWATASAVGTSDPLLAPMLAAAAAGVLANGTSRVMRMPAAVFLVPGIILLVPGVLGMRSLDAMMDADPVGGIATAVGTVLVGTGIAAGLLVANAALPPRGSN
jgi:uncharacterized membrane protein YjjP (DUF1212 family)